MKKIVLFIAMLLVTNTFFAQQGINYKAIITDNDVVLASASIDVQFTILENGTTNVYQETHNTTTDANGIIILNIGEGTMVSGNFNIIDWSVQQFLKVEINTGSGYVDFGTTAFKSVPYAKHAETASNVENPFWFQTSNATNSPYPVGIGEDTANEANLHINDITGGLPLLKMTSDDNIYTIWQSNRIGVDDYLIGIDGGNNKFTFANFTTSQYPLTLQEAKVGINNLNPSANLDVIGTMKYVDGNQGNGKVLTSDASGNVSWQTATGVTALNDLSDATTLNQSYFMGNGAGNTTFTGSSNNGLGYHALQSLTTGSYNNAFGYLSLGANTTGVGNSGFGQWTLTSNVNGSYNTTIGYAALYKHTSGNNNTALGAYAGFENLTGTGNVFIGANAGRDELGSNKLYIENTTSTTPLIGGDFGTNQVTINGALTINDGSQGLNKVLTSDATGNASWQEASVSELNDLSDAIYDGQSLYLGYQAGINDDNSNYNTAIGRQTMKNTTSGRQNITLGAQALLYNETGSYNAALGEGALYFNVAGSRNLAIGEKSGFNTLGDGNVFIGYQSGLNETGSNKLYIENSNSATPLIGGDFSTDEVTINGDIEITGDVNGKITTSLSGNADMKAYIYGSVGPDGVNVTNISSDGFTVTKMGTGWYRINAVGMNYYTVTATMRYAMIGFITVEKFADSFDVKTYDTAGVAADRGFDFVVFKK